MPSKKGIEQALTWLKSKAHEKNTLDAVNAELCMNVIMDLQRQYDRLGAQFNNVKNARYEENPAVMKEEQLSFIEEDSTHTSEQPAKKPARTMNTPLYEKGDVHNEIIREKTIGVRNRESDS